MFSIGFLEIVLIFVLAIILLKPEDWPNLLYQAGRLFKKVRIFSRHLNRSFEAVMDTADLEKIPKKNLSTPKSPHSKGPPAS